MTASVSGRVWFDGNNNGRPDTGEVAIPGVTVVLSGTDLRGQTVMVTSMTASDGTYRFDGLPGGTYVVSRNSAQSPGGWPRHTRHRQWRAVLASKQTTSSRISFWHLSNKPSTTTLVSDVCVQALTRCASSLPPRRLWRRSCAKWWLAVKNMPETAQRCSHTPGRGCRGAAHGLPCRVHGHERRDVFTFTAAGNSLSPDATQHLVVANGIQWVFKASEVNTLVMTGSGGDDQIELARFATRRPTGGQSGYGDPQQR